jgi:hypothetical protein
VVGAEVVVVDPAMVVVVVLAAVVLVRRGGGGAGRGGARTRAVLDVQHGGGRETALPGVRDPPAGTGQDDRQRVATVPARPVHDLLDDGGQVGRPLLKAGCPGR